MMRIFRNFLASVAVLSIAIAAAVQAREAVVLTPAARLTGEDIATINQAGVKLGSYLGEGRYEASVAEGELGQVRRRLMATDERIALEPMPVAVKLQSLLRGHPALPDSLLDRQGKVSVTIVPAPGQDNDAFTTLLRRFDPSTTRNPKIGGWAVTIEPEQIEQLAALPQVASVRRAPTYPTLR